MRKQQGFDYLNRTELHWTAFLQQNLINEHEVNTLDNLWSYFIAVCRFMSGQRKCADCQAGWHIRIPRLFLAWFGLCFYYYYYYYFVVCSELFDIILSVNLVIKKIYNSNSPECYSYLSFNSPQSLQSLLLKLFHSTSWQNWGWCLSSGPVIMIWYRKFVLL